MSYILDALRRADAERAAVPGLHDQSGLAPLDEDDDFAGRSPSRSHLAWAVGGAMLVLAAAILTWHWSDGAEEPSTASSLRVPRSGNVTAGGLAVSAVDTDTSRSPVHLAPLQRLPPTAAGPRASLSPLPDGVLKATSSAASRPAVPVGPAGAVPSPSLSQDLGSDRHAQSKPVGPVSAARPVERVPTQAELPEEVRRQLPPLKLSGSVYSPDPSVRMLVLNGQVFHERDDVGNGVMIEQIKPRAAILHFRGYRYQMTY